MSPLKVIKGTKYLLGNDCFPFKIHKDIYAPKLQDWLKTGTSCELCTRNKIKSVRFADTAWDEIMKVPNFRHTACGNDVDVLFVN